MYDAGTLKILFRFSRIPLSVYDGAWNLQESFHCFEQKPEAFEKKMLEKVQKGLEKQKVSFVPFAPQVPVALCGCRCENRCMILGPFSYGRTESFECRNFMRNHKIRSGANCQLEDVFALISYFLGEDLREKQKKDILGELLPAAAAGEEPELVIQEELRQIDSFQKNHTYMEEQLIYRRIKEGDAESLEKTDFYEAPSHPVLMGDLKKNEEYMTVISISLAARAAIVGRMGCVFSVIEDNHIHHINNMQQLTGAEVAGIKFHAAIDVIFRRNHIHHCTMGIWTDWQAQGTRITQNLLHDNFIPEFLPLKENGMGFGMDLFIEVGHGPILVDNNLLLSRTAVRWATQGVALVHNLILGSFSAVGTGTDMTANGKNQPRYTPYHIPHRTEVAGFMTILHGDNRIYNNIIIQKWDPADRVAPGQKIEKAEKLEAGTFWFDEYPAYEEWIRKFKLGERADMNTMHELLNAHFDPLPVWIDGNAYFNGARPWKKEAHKLEDKEHKVYAELTEEKGKYRLKTNVYDFLKDFQDGIIHSGILGEAFEPEERYENPDGSDIVLNEDYFGNHRGLTAVPGPAARGTEFEAFVWE